MSSAKYDMNICQGADFKLVLTITDSEGNLLNLDDHTFRGQIRQTISSPDVIASFSFNKLDQVTDTGKVEIKLSSADSSAIALPEQNSIERQAVDFAYDIESETSGGEVKRWLEGKASISPEVTR